MSLSSYVSLRHKEGKVGHHVMDNTNNNEPIDFLIKDQNGEETMFNIKRTTKMGKVFTRMIVTEGCRSGIPRFPY